MQPCFTSLCDSITILVEFVKWNFQCNPSSNATKGRVSPHSNWKQALIKFVQLSILKD